MKTPVSEARWMRRVNDLTSVSHGLKGPISTSPKVELLTTQWGYETETGTMMVDQWIPMIARITQNFRFLMPIMGLPLLNY